MTNARVQLSVFTTVVLYSETRHAKSHKILFFMKYCSVGILSIILSDTSNNNLSLSVTKRSTFSGCVFVPMLFTMYSKAGGAAQVAVLVGGKSARVLIFVAALVTSTSWTGSLHRGGMELTRVSRTSYV